MTKTVTILLFIMAINTFALAKCDTTNTKHSSFAELNNQNLRSTGEVGITYGVFDNYLFVSSDTCFRIESFPNTKNVSYLSPRLASKSLNREEKVREFLRELLGLFVSTNRLDIINVNMNNKEKWEIQIIIEIKKWENDAPFLKLYLMQFNLSTIGIIENARLSEINLK